MNHSPTSSTHDQVDPLVLHARRETLVILLAFVVCLVWSISWCYSFGYSAAESGSVTSVMGIPSWVFWGVMVPWLAADVFAFWFCFYFMVDDPLGETGDESAGADDGGAGSEREIEEAGHA